MPLPGGGAEGLLVETHEGRPTKVEGNPLHPNNMGKSTVWSQASVLNMYDPDRLKYPVFTPHPGDHRVASWDDFKNWAKENFARFDSSRGKGGVAPGTIRTGRDGMCGPRPPDEIGVLAVRGGDVSGDHTVMLLGNGERLELTHRASSRQVFAQGALRAARWVVGKPPRLYDMEDMLGLK